MISEFPYKVHEVDSYRVITITAHNERRNHEKKKFVLQDALIIRESLEQQDLQGRESKIWIIYSVAGASRRSSEIM
ncbi:hypothetical protein P4576_05370 [Peribacillus frigoritolerans]|uniref:hypothetical protein n=1 Tax=Peribacillus frigoritolerans TaxID=450367 RepID=UPI002E1D9982|nr:hypothetical protein [Peribacillus frigoritolerans]